MAYRYTVSSDPNFSELGTLVHLSATSEAQCLTFTSSKLLFFLRKSSRTVQELELFHEVAVLELHFLNWF